MTTTSEHCFTDSNKAVSHSHTWEKFGFSKSRLEFFEVFLRIPRKSLQFSTLQTPRTQWKSAVCWGWLNNALGSSKTSPPSQNCCAKKMGLQPYNFKVEYRKGADNPANYMSRNPKLSQTGDSTRASQATPRAMTLRDQGRSSDYDCYLVQNHDTVWWSDVSRTSTTSRCIF